MALYVAHLLTAHLPRLALPAQELGIERSQSAASGNGRAVAAAEPEPEQQEEEAQGKAKKKKGKKVRGQVCNNSATSQCLLWPV